MDKKQLKLMINLAKKLREEKRDKKEILISFVSAGILTTHGNYTKNFSELKKIEKASKSD
jgi:hypothetical protein